MARPAPLLSLKAARLGFGGTPLFQDLDLMLYQGERVSLVGRNGSGKSTLLRLVAGEIEADSGERILQARNKIGYLPQDPTLPPEQSVHDFVASGLPHKDKDAHYMVNAVVEQLKLDPKALLGTLSGGEGRRAALARTLLDKPDILLLDEPTNHLDLPTITWLEEELTSFKGALMLISHDRAFLTRVSNRVFWLDRGQINRLDKGFGAFDTWADELRQQEEQELYRLKKTIEREEHWHHRGVTARRKRNEGRLARLHALRAQRRELISNQRGELKMAAAEADKSGKSVIETKNLTKSFLGEDGQEVAIVKDFTTRIRRGDRLGIVGRNGAGKTTLVKLLLDQIETDSGTVKLGTKLEIETFDQRRANLDYNATLWETLCPGGGDMLSVGGQQRHVIAYLRDFLFDEKQIRQPVSALSGGEKNRLLLARILARPSNLLVLDEPTNDLDMETLDLLLELLDDYEGTLILVSHDRDFIDRLCTSVILMDGKGGAQEYPGGFTDAIRQAGGLPETREALKPAAAPKAAPAQPKKRNTAKLSYKDQRELDGLPKKMEELNANIAKLEAALADPNLFTRDPDAFQKHSADLTQKQEELEMAELRWLELEELQEQLASGAGA